MHEHDQEIIMALAEGTLDDAATAAAETAISACAECTADLELQRFALAALDEVPEVYLTATESARLHSALKAELVGATTPPIRAKTGFAWGRWLPVAGVAAVFLAAIVSLPALFGGSDDDGDADSVAAPALESAETRAAPETTAAATEQMMSDAAGMAGDDTMSLEAPTATTESMAEATTTTAAMSETTTSADRRYFEDLDFLGSVADLERDALIEIVTSQRAALEEEADLAKSLDPVFAACVLTNTSPEVAPTMGIPIDSEALLLGLVVTPIGEELVLVAYVPEDVEDTVFVTQQALICEVVEVLP